MLLVVNFDDMERNDLVLSQEARLAERFTPSLTYTWDRTPTISLSAIEGLICDFIIYRCSSVEEPRLGSTGFELDFESLFMGL